MGALDGRVALVTGAAAGIGRASAQIFSREGARVAITGRNQTTLDAAAAKLGPNALAFNADDFSRVSAIWRLSCWLVILSSPVRFSTSCSNCTFLLLSKDHQ